MSALDKNGNQVGFGDYVATTIIGSTDGTAVIVRVLKLTETTRGLVIRGKYVSKSGRDGKLSPYVDFDPAKSTLVAKDNGEVVS